MPFETYRTRVKSIATSWLLSWSATTVIRTHSPSCSTGGTFVPHRLAVQGYAREDRLTQPSVAYPHPSFVFAPFLQTAAEGSNLYGRENIHYPVMETYAEGGILEVKVVASTYHWVRWL